MSKASTTVKDLARRLVAFEAARRSVRGVGGGVRVCEKLRVPLARLAGVAAFHSLLSRSLALATAEADATPALRAVRALPDGSLNGLDEAVLGVRGSDGGAGIAVVAQLLGLLEAFIGWPLTVRLVRDAWPDGPSVEPGSSDGSVCGEVS